MRHIYIDPGKSGGLCMTIDGVVSYVRPLGDTITDMLLSIQVALPQDNEPVKATIEKVHSMPGQGVASSFTFGENFGMIQGILVALKVPYQFITPQQWQKYIKCMPRIEDKSKRKKWLQDYARINAPGFTITLKTSDAVAMAIAIGDVNDRFNNQAPSRIAPVSTEWEAPTSKRVVASFFD